MLRRLRPLVWPCLTQWMAQEEHLTLWGNARLPLNPSLATQVRRLSSARASVAAAERPTLSQPVPLSSLPQAPAAVLQREEEQKEGDQEEPQRSWRGRPAQKRSKGKKSKPAKQSVSSSSHVEEEGVQEEKADAVADAQLLPLSSLFYRGGSMPKRAATLGSPPSVPSADKFSDQNNSTSSSLLGSPHERYEARVRDFFVNPFNGKQVGVQTTTAQELERLGFHRDVDNPLHLRWSPDTYFRRFHTTLHHILRRRQRALEREREARARAAAAAKRVRRRKPPSHSTTTQNDGDEEGKVKCDLIHGHPSSLPSLPPPPTSVVELADITTEEVLDVMLRRLEKPAPRAKAPGWRQQVAELIRRHDALTAVPVELARRYASLTSAYLPPKLDATPDPAVREVQLTADQENVVQLAVRGYHLFVGGSAGTGKTVLIKAIHQKLAGLRLRVAMTATTGVAAVQLGGCTFHRAFNVPVEEAGLTARKSWDYNALRAVDVVIIDEVSLLSAHMLDAFDMESRLARMHYKPFGGIQVIVCGDFLQLASQSTADAQPAYGSEAFEHLLQLKLVTPMRHLAGDPLIELLRGLRCGRCDTALLAKLDRPVPPDARQVTYIFPRRREAQLLNDAKLSELQTAEMVCTPQRGPLELVGTFTHAALITFSESPKALPLPPRDEMVAIVREEVAATLSLGAPAQRSESDELSRNSSGPVPLFKELAEHDIVVMPTRTTEPGITLRLRVHVDPLEVLARRESARQAKRFVRAQTNAEASAAVSEGRSGAADAAAAGGDDLLRRAVAGISGATAPSPSPSQQQSQQLLSPPSLLSPPAQSAAAHMHRHPELWAATVERIAARLRGRVVELFEKEPTALVPLAVSVALTEAGEGELAEHLQPLRLKLGCRVMVNRNLSRSVSNGSVGVVEAFAPPDHRLFPFQIDTPMRSSSSSFRRHTPARVLFPQLPVVRLLSGEVVQVPPVATMLGGTPLTYYYGHEAYTLPLQLGYGFTVHKVQGLTLHGTVVLDCKHFFRCPHLIYVACSRVRSMDQLVVWNLKPEMVLVQQGALEFSEGLREAKDALVLGVPPEVPRASWATRANPHIYSL